MLTATLRLYSPAGQLLPSGVITNYTSLGYSKILHNVGLIKFVLPGDHPVIEHLEDQCQATVTLKDLDRGIDPWVDWEGFYREPQKTGYRPIKFAGTGVDCKSLLSRRIVAYKASISNYSVFSGLELDLVMKRIVDYNCCANATTANGRERNGAITGFTTGSVSSVGNIGSWYCSFNNVLTTLQELAPLSGGDFDVIKTGVASWRWDWYQYQLGSDLTDTLTFSVGRGNMESPVWNLYRIQEKTVAIVGGQDNGVNRQITITTGANYSSSNDIEVFVNAPQALDATTRTAKGDAKLAELESVEEFSFKIKDVESSLYGRDYGFGDLVNAVNPYDGSSIDVQITRVDVDIPGPNRAPRIAIQATNK